MIKRFFGCLSFSFISLFAGVEYGVVLLAPEGEEFITCGETRSMYDRPVNINEAGYVFGTYHAKDNYEDRNAYIFHQKFGFKKITLPNNATICDYDPIISVNNQGIAVGIFECSQDVGVFVFDANTEKCYDLLEAFGTKELSGFSIKDRILIQLCITDDNRVIFNPIDVTFINDPTYIYNVTTYIYDLNQKSVSLLQHGILRSVNSKGQMLEESWFLDPKTGFHELGSLDLFNRWDVHPLVLSQNGIVAGWGYDSHHEKKGFTWSLEAGFVSFDMGRDAYILGVNNYDHVIGTYREYDIKTDYYFDRTFLYAPEYGFLKLGVFDRGESHPYAFNNHSQIVGTSSILKYKKAAYIWDLEKGMRNLSTLIPQNGGWEHLKKATGINDSGCIVGCGKYYGMDHHFLLIPKKPHSE